MLNLEPHILEQVESLVGRSIKSLIQTNFGTIYAFFLATSCSNNHKVFLHLSKPFL